MTIGFRITLLMVVLNIICVGVVGVALILRAWQNSESVAINYTLNKARHLGGQFESFLESRFSALEASAAVMGRFESVPADARRSFLDGAVRGMAGAAGEAAWVIWNRDALDGPDAARIGAPGTDGNGRFVAAYARTAAGGSAASLMQGFEAEGFYLQPLVTGRRALANPAYRLLAGERRSVVTFSVPVRNPAGVTVAVAGLDIPLAQMNERGQDIEIIYDGTFAAVFSADGAAISHPAAGNLGRNLRETERALLGQHLVAFADAVGAGQERRFDFNLGGAFFRFHLVPVGAGGSAWVYSLALPMNKVGADAFAMVFFALKLCGMTIVMVLLASFFVSRGISRPIARMATVLRDISSGGGDLTVRLPEGGSSEIADASHYFNQTIGKIRELIVTIKKRADALAGIGDELYGNMTNTALAMNQIAANIQNIKDKVINQGTSVAETYATMEQITSNINRLGDHVERQGGAVVQSSAAVEQMLASIQSVTVTLGKNAKNVEDLRESSQSSSSSLQDVVDDIQAIARESQGLLEINDLMEEIASQTNLLSMNAAIEAAHAGDAGKGFAVVAEEIRKLAESSGEQSKAIGGMLRKIKESIDTISVSTDKVLKKFEAIDSGVRRVAEQEQDIRRAMDEQAQGSKQVLSASALVSEITQEVKGGSLRMSEGSKEVLLESKKLEGAAQEITNGINEMAAGTDQVNRAVNNVNDLSNKNQENIASLVQALSQFKV